MKIRKESILLASVCILSLILQFVTFVNYVLVVFQIVVISTVSIQKSIFIKSVALSQLLCFSFFYGELALNIYSFKLFGYSILYLILIVAVFIRFIKKQEMDKIVLAFAMLFLFYLSRGVFNLLVIETAFFFRDAVQYLIIGFTYLIFKDEIEINELINIFIICTVSFFLTKVILFTLDLGIVSRQYSSTIILKNVLYGPNDVLFTMIGFSLAFLTTNKTYRLLGIGCILLIFINIMLYKYIGTNTLISILLITFVSIIKHFRNIIIYIVFLFVLLNVIYSIIQIESTVIFYKIENIISIYNFLNFIKDDFAKAVYNTPRSIQVRIIELINIIRLNNFDLFFGSGFGGFFTEEVFNFQNNINLDDYSIIELTARKFTTPHNVAFPLLKFGFVYFGVIFSVFLQIRKYIKNKDEFFLVIVLFIMSIFNFGFGIIPSICVAVLLLFFHESIRKSTEF